MAAQHVIGGHRGGAGLFETKVRRMEAVDKGGARHRCRMAATTIRGCGGSGNDGLEHRIWIVVARVVVVGGGTTAVGGGTR